MILVYRPFEGKGISLIQYKLVYLGIQAIVLGIAGNKLSKMGLLPTSAPDWIDLVSI